MATVLIIDDDERILRALSRILENAGHEVRQASNGRQALRRLAGDPTDLVITDVYMPEMDGIEFVMKLREIYPEIPVIAMSGESMLPTDVVFAATEALGAVATLPKPLTEKAILAEVARALEKHPV